MKNLARILLLAMFSSTILISCKTKKAEIDMSNPFFTEYNTPFEVPPFEKIKAVHYLPAFEKGMADGREELHAILESKDAPTFENTVIPFSEMGTLLNRVAYVFFGLSSANTNDSLQNIEVEISPRLSQYSDEITLNPDLFKRIKSVYDNQSNQNLNEEQKYLLENLYKGFVRSGALLSTEDQNILKDLNQKLSVLSVKFSQNVLAETNKFRLVIENKEDLKGLPQSVIDGAAAMAKSAGWKGNGFSRHRNQVCCLSLLTRKNPNCAKHYMMHIFFAVIITIALIIRRHFRILLPSGQKGQNSSVIKLMLI